VLAKDRSFSNGGWIGIAKRTDGARRILAGQVGIGNGKMNSATNTDIAVDFRKCHAIALIVGFHLTPVAEAS
jgi:hypothetical protein